MLLLLLFRSLVLEPEQLVYDERSLVLEPEQLVCDEQSLVLEPEQLVYDAVSGTGTRTTGV